MEGPLISLCLLLSFPTGNAIQAFGNGTDVNLSPKNPSFQATQAPRVEKTPSLPDDLSDSTSLGTSVITTCTSVQVRGCSSAAGETEPGQSEGLEKHLMPEARWEITAWGPGTGRASSSLWITTQEAGRADGG